MYVSIGTGDDANPGTPDAPKATIKAGIDAALVPAWVMVAEGIYNVEYQLPSGTHVVLVEGISLYGGYATDWSIRDPATHATIVTDGSASGGSFPVPNRTVEAGAAITAATVIDGFTLNGGGGIYSSALFVSGAPTIRNNTINGGSGSTLSIGVFNAASSPAIRNNSIDGGTGGSGSNGILNSGGSAEISGNTVNGGGSVNSSHGIKNDSSSPTISGNTIHGGSASNVSYGIINSVSSPVIRNNAVHGGGGGVDSYGIYNGSSSSPAIRNNTVNGGSGGANAYGIYNVTPVIPSSPAVDNNIVFTTLSGANNRYCLFESDANSDPVSMRKNALFECPTALYHDGDGGGDLTNIADVNDYTKTTQDIGQPSSGNISADPLFENQAGGDWHFTVLSPASVIAGGLNGVDDGGWGFTDDKDGVTRPASGTAWAIGAYEP